MRQKFLFSFMVALSAIVLLGCPSPVTPPKDTVINIAAISGVTTPVKGATPVTTITENDQYTGTVAWNDNTETFAANTVYTATITLTAKTGYTLDGVATNFFTVKDAVATNSVSSGVVTAVFPSTAADVVSISAISGVTAPVKGATPVTTITETDQYTGTVTWNDNPATFAANMVYTATITLTPKAGFTFTGVTENFFTVAGAEAANAADSGVITAEFPATEAVPGTVISISVIPGVTAPVKGATPVTTITATDQYTGTVTWNGSPETFASNTVYTATITLTAKTGYTFTGVAANYFTVAGATATNAVDSGVVTAVFPATSILTMVDVPGGRFQRDATSTNISIITQPYRMSQNEITREQFLAIMGTDPSDTTYSSGTTDPVQMVNWYHTLVFCNKLSEAEGLTPVYSISGTTNTTSWGAVPTTSDTTWDAVAADWTANGYRLPTEMEWKWAAMGAPADGQGGGTNTTGYNKAFAGSTGSNSIGDYVVFGYVDGGTGRTTTERSNPVGTKLSNELGLYDMSGNVFEWCWDWNSDDGTYFNCAVTGTQSDYRGAASGTDRVTLGSCWIYNEDYCTMAFRFYKYPDCQNELLGFRVVRP